MGDTGRSASGQVLHDCKPTGAEGSGWEPRACARVSGLLGPLCSVGPSAVSCSGRPSRGGLCQCVSVGGLLFLRRLLLQTCGGVSTRPRFEQAPHGATDFERLGLRGG